MFWSSIKNKHYKYNYENIILMNTIFGHYLKRISVQCFSRHCIQYCAIKYDQCSSTETFYIIWLQVKSTFTITVLRYPQITGYKPWVKFLSPPVVIPLLKSKLYLHIRCFMPLHTWIQAYRAIWSILRCLMAFGRISNISSTLYKYTLSPCVFSNCTCLQNCIP